VTALVDSHSTALAVAPVRSRGQRWRRRYGLAAAGAAIILAWILIALLAPLLTPYHPDAVDVTVRLQPPSRAHWLGTDALGRDVLAQVVYGARTSVIIGICTVALACLVGVAVGTVAGYFRGWLDTILARGMDILLAFPAILLTIVIAGAFERSVVLVVAALSATAWISFARVTRGIALSLRERPWVDAARVLGVPRLAILGRHILPFTIGPVVALATLEFALVVLAEAGLSFLGIGLPNSAVSWGQTIANGKQYLESAWWISALPGIALSVLIVNIGILGDQLTARYGRGHVR
jgi:ABC-type dipeptide/oligopeptide/nickel transport system permease subunit